MPERAYLLLYTPRLPQGFRLGSSGNLCFELHEHIPVDNGFAAAFHIVFRHLAVVGGTFLVKDADRVGLLQKGITDALLICLDVRT